MDDARASSSNPVDSPVCDVCKGLLNLENPRGFVLERPPQDPYYAIRRYIHTYIHHANTAVLLASAEAGCGICTVICDVLRRQSPRGLDAVDAYSSPAQGVSQPASKTPALISDDDVLTATHLAELAKQEGLYERRDLGVHDDGRLFIQSSFNEKFGLPRPSYVSAMEAITFMNFHLHKRSYPLICLNISGDLDDPGLQHRPAKDLLSKPHISLINRWRHICGTYHSSCRLTEYNQPLLPSRVLELLDPSDESRGVRLVETQSKMRRKYACLSYCWGDSKTQTGQTTRENFPRQLKGIAFQDLASTVVDAIRLCYKLGFRFLWVDRLCIVQDDNNDWLEEASRMCEVYSRSALTISVPICVDSSESFLDERRKAFREESEFARVTHAEGESDSKRSSWFTAGNLSRQEGPWFLEKSWRNFSSEPNNSGNRWLRRGWTFQEWMLSPRVLHIDSITLWDCYGGYANELNRRRMGEANLLRAPSHFGKAISWELIVQEYSRREITYEEDRLPALAGLAAKYAWATRYTYLAGLWREELPRTLFWKGCGPASRRAPSWSWASTNGRVDFVRFYETFTTRAVVISNFCHHDPPASVSAVEKAWLDVDGHISVVKEQEEMRRVKTGDEWWWTKPDQGDRYPDDAIAQASISLVLLGSESGILRTKTTHHALVLQACGWEDGLQCFRRLGVASMLTEYDEGDWRHPRLGPSWKARIVRLV